MPRQPVPAKLFWSVTVYDARTRSEIRTGQNQAAIRSMFELAGTPAGQLVPVPLFAAEVTHLAARLTAPGSRHFPASAGSSTSASTVLTVLAFDGTWASSRLPGQLAE